MNVPSCTSSVPILHSVTEGNLLKRENQMPNQSAAINTNPSEASISAPALDQLFRNARTHSAWRPEPVPTQLLRKIYDLARLGPTSANASPARFLFLTTPEAKARLKPALMPVNVEKTMAAPVTLIIAWDNDFH